MLAKACVCALVAVAATPCGAATYANARFGYTVSYPEDLLAPKPEAANGDGRTFRSRDGRASFAVFAAYADAAPRDVARSAAEVCRGTQPALLLVKPRLVAVSCIHDGLIYYAKVLLGHGTQTQLIAAYPLGERATWDRVTTRMADTLRPAVR